MTLNCDDARKWIPGTWSETWGIPSSSGSTPICGIVLSVARSKNSVLIRCKSSLQSPMFQCRTTSSFTRRSVAPGGWRKFFLHRVRAGESPPWPPGWPSRY